MDQRDRDVLSRPALLGALRFLAFLLVALASLRAAAADRALLVPPALETAPGRFVAARETEDPGVVALGAELERALADAVEDMAFSAGWSRAREIPGDGALTSLAAGRWVFAARFTTEAGGMRLRLLAVMPGAKVLLVREEELGPGELSALPVRTVVMVRDLVQAGRRVHRDHALRRPTRLRSLPPPHQSSGRPVLALHSALLGGYLGFSVQRASSSPDSRLVYPMVALGAGLGLGASLLVADEWDVSESDAWYLAAGIYWPGAAGFLLAESYDARTEERWLYGLLGATGGLGLATSALALSRVSQGGAALAHSGGAFGMLFGAIGEIAVEGESSGTPTRGMGYGAGAGVLAAGVLATAVDVSSSRVLLMDLSASLGGLGAAALASPLLIVDQVDRSRTRLFLGAVGLGTVAGGVLGYYLTSDTGTADAAIAPYAQIEQDQGGAAFALGARGRW